MFDIPYIPFAKMFSLKIITFIFLISTAILNCKAQTKALSKVWASNFKSHSITTRDPYFQFEIDRFLRGVSTTPRTTTRDPYFQFEIDRFLRGVSTTPRTTTRDPYFQFEIDRFLRGVSTTTRDSYLQWEIDRFLGNGKK